MADIKKLYLIGYDLLKKPEEDYEELITAIRLIDKDAVHELDSTWLVNSEATTATIRGFLKPHLHDKDRLLVVQITPDADWASLYLPLSAAKLTANA